MKLLKVFFIFLSISFFMLIAYSVSCNFLEPKTYNFMVKNFTATNHGSEDIVIIVIDDKSIGKYRWPWKRNLYCKIFNYFNDYAHPRLLVNDSIFVTKDVENVLSDIEYFNCLKRTNNIVVGFDFLIKDANQVPKNYDLEFDKKFKIDIKDYRTEKNQDIYRAILPFPKDYFDSVKMVGTVKTPISRDGFLRSIPYVIQYKNQLYQSLSLRAFSYLNDDESYIAYDNFLLGSNSGIKIPRNNDKSGFYSLIKYYKRYDRLNYSHKIYSAIDIMDSYDQLREGKTPQINPDVFAGKIVFIGANVKAAATGLSDIQRTPISNEHSGVDVQATVLDNLISNDFMYPISSSYDFLISLVAMVVIYLLIRNFSLFISATVTFILTAVYLLICAYMFHKGIVLNVITPISLSIITMIFAYSHRFIIEGRNKEKIQNAMGKYISEDIMKSVVKNIDELKLGGKKANVTVLFSDIRGFTSMSEKLSPDEISVILNEYFTEMEPIVTKHHGVINKFIGDAVMVIFGEPIQDENHAVNSIRCAAEMLEKVKELRQKWLDEGKPKIEIGIGINTGEVFVGNIGSENRMEYTVIGDTVNLASRIESYNKTYKTNFLISASTYARVKNIVDVVKISNVTIRGKSKKTDLYEVISLIGQS